MYAFFWVCVCVFLSILALLAGLQINTSKSPGFLCPASEAVMNSEDSADWTSDPENRPLNRNERCHHVISVFVNKWNAEREENTAPFTAFLIFDSPERPQSSEESHSKNEMSTIWKEKWCLFWKCDCWQNIKMNRQAFQRITWLKSLAEETICRMFVDVLSNLAKLF